MVRVTGCHIRWWSWPLLWQPIIHSGGAALPVRPLADWLGRSCHGSLVASPPHSARIQPDRSRRSSLALPSYQTCSSCSCYSELARSCIRTVVGAFDTTGDGRECALSRWTALPCQCAVCFASYASTARLLTTNQRDISCSVSTMLAVYAIQSLP